MNKDWVEEFEFLGEGYQTMIAYDGWRVAILRFLDELLPERIQSMERHCETDEVFVLLKGRASLLLGGNGSAPENVVFYGLDPHKLYNVKRNVWHNILLSQDASVLIVENRDTCEENSQSCDLSPDHCLQIIDQGHKEKF